MINIQELKEWADDLKPILFDINLSLKNLWILKDERLNSFRVNYFDTYLNLLYQQNFILVIQLDKIFSKSKYQKRNINILFNNLQAKESYPEILSQHNNADDFKSMEDILREIDELKAKIEEFREIIDHIDGLRKKVFAHTDPNCPDDIIDIVGYTALADLSNRIYNTLFGKIIGDQFNPNIVNKYDLRILFDLSEVH